MRILATMLFGCTVFGGSKFEPPFKSEVHEPRAEDAGAVKTLQALDHEARFLLIHGHFLGDARETVVAAALRRVKDGDEVYTILLSRNAAGWILERREPSFSATYCRSLRVSTEKDVLLCYTSFSRKSGIDTHLYAVDFTREPADSRFFEVTDTAATASPCPSLATLKSVNFDGSLHLVVDYGRSSSPTAEILHRSYTIEFRLGAAGFSPIESSKKDFDFVTARGDCSAN